MFLLIANGIPTTEWTEATNPLLYLGLNFLTYTEGSATAFAFNKQATADLRYHL